MKKILILAFAVLCMTTIFGQTISTQPKVAVYVTGGNDAGIINKVLGDQLVTAFAKSGKYIAIERTSSFLFELSKEQNYQQTGAVDDNEFSRLGKQFGVQLVCVVEVNDIFNEKYVSARLIDVESAQVTDASNAKGQVRNIDDLLKISNEIITALIKKTQEIPQKTQPMPNIIYVSHVTHIGWQSPVSNGMIAGTTGRNNRVEAFRIRLDCPVSFGNVRYCAHVEGIGWQSYVTNNEYAGTVGLSKRIEAIRIELVGEIKTVYDVYYRVHIQDKGWSDWLLNGMTAGTTGEKLQLEAFQVKLVLK
jgi:uncharacterized protein YjdB